MSKIIAAWMVQTFLVHWRFLLLFMGVASVTQGNFIGTLLITNLIRWTWRKLTTRVWSLYDESTT